MTYHGESKGFNNICRRLRNLPDFPGAGQFYCGCPYGYLCIMDLVSL